MADFTLSKPIFGGKQPKPPRRVISLMPCLSCSVSGRVRSYSICWFMHQGVYEHLMQVQDNGRPRVEIGFGVSTLFGLIPFLAGCMILGVVALVLRFRRRF